MESQRSLFNLKVGFLEQNLFGEATDFSKQKVKQVASQKFLKMIFPENQTWNGILWLVPAHKGDDLATHLRPSFRAFYENCE